MSSNRTKRLPEYWTAQGFWFYEDLVQQLRDGPFVRTITKLHGPFESLAGAIDTYRHRNDVSR